MKNGIKKKFMDILFEPDGEEIFPAEQEEKEEESVKAKDILYRKSDRFAFIDLEEKPRSADVSVEEKTASGDYEFASQISPIFGVIRSGEQKKTETAEMDESLVSKPENSHLDIITSPIYGYGNREETEEKETPAADNYDEEELHYLLDEREGDLPYEDYPDDDIDLFDDFGEER